MTTVKDVLDEKGRDVYSVSPDASVYEALKLMADHDIASLVVLNEGKLIGIMSERIYAREIILKGRTSVGTLVREVMSTRVLYARPYQSVQECMAVMAANDHSPSACAPRWRAGWRGIDWRYGQKRYRRSEI